MSSPLLVDRDDGFDFRVDGEVTTAASLKTSLTVTVLEVLALSSLTPLGVVDFVVGLSVVAASSCSVENVEGGIVFGVTESVLSSLTVDGGGEDESFQSGMVTSAISILLTFSQQVVPGILIFDK